MGGIGGVMSRDFQPCSRVVVPFCSTSFQAPMPLAVGTSSQRVPSESCQLERAAPFALVAAAVVIGAVILAVSRTWILPSLAAAAASVLSLYWKSTGAVVSSCLA